MAGWFDEKKKEVEGKYKEWISKQPKSVEVRRGSAVVSHFLSFFSLERICFLPSPAASGNASPPAPRGCAADLGAC